MNWIKTEDLRSWASSRSCQETLPLLMRKLIRATTSSIHKIKFPSGNNVLVGGWDGILETEEATEYLPLGVSLWEFGASRDVKAKADSDYEKRTKNPLGFKPSESCFVFVTPRLWSKGVDWVSERKKEGIWKDIRVINAEILEEWLEIAPSVASWLAIDNLGKFPEGVQSTEDYWEEWSRNSKHQLSPKILLGSRDKEKTRLLESAKSGEITAIQASSRSEALAFIIASSLDSPEKLEDFFARSLIIDSPEIFRRITVLKSPLILIPRFEDSGVINRGALKGHTVLVPLDNNAPNNWGEKIQLPRIGRNPFIEAMKQSGFSEEQSEKLSKESARNLTILRRQLEFERQAPQWALAENYRDLVPALLVGRWNEYSEGDKAIIEKIAGESYENYIRKLSRWLNSQDSPIIKISGHWRLASVLDAWNHLGKFLTKADYEDLKAVFKHVMGETHPMFDLEPEKRYMASFVGKTSIHSGLIREGLSYSMIIVSIYAEKLGFNLPQEDWVDKIVEELLSPENHDYWRTIGGKLALIAEASPTSFLNVVDSYMRKGDSPVLCLFEEIEDKGNIFRGKSSYQTGLLWALEGLAWFPKYFDRACMILAFLEENANEVENMANIPVNSLKAIFKSWNYKTYASFDQRVKVLQMIRDKQPQTAWKLLLSLLPKGHDSSFGTFNMRWRECEQSYELVYNYQEIWNTTSVAVNLLIGFSNYTESQMNDLIRASTKIPQTDRKKILGFIGDLALKNGTNKNLVWHSIREILSMHRSHPNQDWALPETALQPYQELFSKLEPSDIIQNKAWIFKEHSPSFPDGKINNLKYKEAEKIIKKIRVGTLGEIYSQHGIEIVMRLGEIDNLGFLGGFLANMKLSEKEKFLIRDWIMEKDFPNRINFSYSFIATEAKDKGFGWAINLYKELKTRGLDKEALALILLTFEFSEQLWQYIEGQTEEIQIAYWKKINPWFSKLEPTLVEYGLNRLMQYGRNFTALRCANFEMEKVSSNLLIEVMKYAAKGGDELPAQHDDFMIQQLFETLDNREDASKQEIVILELIYLPYLTNRNGRTPKYIHEELATTPKSFVELLKWMYLSEDEDLKEKERDGLNNDFIRRRGEAAYKIFNSWNTVPGTSENGVITADLLNDWVKEARKLANECGRLKVADMEIGKILSKYPQSEYWPPEPICSVIENINTDTIKGSFRRGIYNSRGVTTRSVNEGGGLERDLESRYRKLAHEHSGIHTNISSIFEGLANEYKNMAKWEDDEAEWRKLEY